MTIRPSPVVALNRAIAVAQSEGAERGLEEIHGDTPTSSAWPIIRFTTLRSVSSNTDATGKRWPGDTSRSALACARNPMEQRFLQQRLNSCLAPREPQASLLSS